MISLTMGQQVVLGKGRMPSLWCYVDNIGDDFYDMQVINGLWCLRLFKDGSGKIISDNYFGSNRDVAGPGEIEIVFSGSLPRSMKHSDYNEVLEYVRTIATKPWVVQKWIVTVNACGRLPRRIRKYLYRVKVSIAAGIKRTKDMYRGIDDEELPF